MKRTSQLWALFALVLGLAHGAASHAAGASLSINGQPGIVLPEKPAKLDVSFGVTRAVLYQDPTLQVYFDSRVVAGIEQKAIIFETCLNDAAARPSVSYSCTYDGRTLEVKDQKRLRRVCWLITKATDLQLQPANLIQPNPLDWSAYQAVPPLALEPVIPKGTDTRTTGARPCLGVRLPWGNNALAAIACGQVYGHLPITLRDPTTLQLVRDDKILLGFNPSGVKGIDPTQHGMKLDTAHSWSVLEAYLASRGTVLERYNAELVESLAVYCCMCDFGGLWKKEMRGSGRSIRAAVDWLNVLRDAGLPEDAFVARHLKDAYAHYEAAATAGDVLACQQGRIFGKENHSYWGVYPFQWAQLLFGIGNYERYTGQRGQFLPKSLDWFKQFPGLPFVYQFSDEKAGPGSPLWSIDKAIAKEKEKFGKEPTRYDERLPEQYVMDCLRVELGKSPTRPLDDPAYAKAFAATPNNPGFAIVPPAKQTTYVVTIGGKQLGPFKTDIETRDGVLLEMKKRLTAWPATTSYSEIIVIERK